MTMTDEKKPTRQTEEAPDYVQELHEMMEECFWKAELAAIKEIEAATKAILDRQPKRHFDPRRARPI